jgi:hypothetical protein
VNVDADVGVGVRVFVPDELLRTVTINSGGLVPSRLEKRVAVVSAEVIAKLYCPPPVTHAVTSTLVQVPPLIAPELAMTAPNAGAFAKVLVDSLQPLFVTWALYPSLELVSAKILSVTLVTVPVIGGTSNRR